MKAATAKRRLNRLLQHISFVKCECAGVFTGFATKASFMELQSSQRALQTLAALLLAVFRKKPRFAHSVSTLSTITGQAILLYGNFQLLAEVWKSRGRKQVMTKAYVTSSLAGFAMLAASNWKIRDTVEGRIMLTCNLLSVAIFSIAAHITFCANSELDEVGGRHIYELKPSAQMLVPFSVSTLIWLVWLFSKLGASKGQVDAVGLVGSLLLAGGTIETAANTALTGRAPLPLDVTRAVSSGITWLWLGTWAIRHTAPGRVYFGMTAYSTALWAIVRAAAENDTARLSAAKLALRSAAKSLTNSNITKP